MRIALILILILLTASTALAQPPKFELQGSMSYVLANGVSFPGEEVDIDGVTHIFNKLSPEDGMSFGAGLGVYLNRNLELAFLWDRHLSELTVSGTTKMSIGDMNIDNYHGVFIYNWGSYLDPIRPFLYGGLGSTVYNGLSYTDLQGRERKPGAKGKFSSTWGAGIKYYPARRFGIQVHFKWTPTYIKSDPGGYWCDPYWGCGTTWNADYSNQWRFGGALLARF